MYRYIILSTCLALSACGVSGASLPSTAAPAQPTAVASPQPPTAQPTTQPSATAISIVAPSPSAAASPAPTTTVVQPSVPQQATPTVSRPASVPSPTKPIAAALVPAAIMAKLRADLTKRAGVEDRAISLVSAEAVTWNDSSLGCPQPGIGYMQVIIEGYRVILQAGGVDYDYRTGQNGQFVLCNK